MKNGKQEILDPRFAGFLLDSMADGVFTLDDEGRITTWNGASGAGQRMPSASWFCSMAAATMRDTPIP
mgnify:CR=1 FL=1